ncbi:RNA polymerase sigma factor [Glycomyces albidus]|uniref:Sigma-70 family RNA polymerase sigma factor n=1 Tax=Glycomyces albidus TaxID=2656774 RepID=A0A6L5GAI1_9ACTN|nr:sigma-70 family RNA polymerase sigma factor [Glycomyces albidus]MQM26719.1 sigma-70 family RNA polymerase sigma factor [Glycomyces albidus]
MDSRLEDVWRRESPHVLGALVRRYGHFDACEDAVQEALLAAAVHWPRAGVPANPRGWLIRAASRRLVDALRSDRARHDRETAATRLEPDSHAAAADDSLHVLLLCCHPSLTPASQVALTLRAVGGLTTEQIAAAFLVPPATMGQRISRAKAKLAAAGARLGDATRADLPDRVNSARQVLYLVFNEGYTATGGTDLLDVSLTAEAIRLTRELRRRLPSDTETAGLLALMLLTEARSPARTDARGDLVPLAGQDRTRWDAGLIAEGTALVEAALPTGPVGPFQLQAAIAAVHSEAARYEDTDWPQIAELYRMLDALAPGPVVTMNRAVAVAMTDGPEAGLAMLDPLLRAPAPAPAHRLHAVRAHLLERAGRPAEARDAFREAARLAVSTPEQRYLLAKAARS